MALCILTWEASPRSCTHLGGFSSVLYSLRRLLLGPVLGEVYQQPLDAVQRVGKGPVVQLQDLHADPLQQRPHDEQVALLAVVHAWCKVSF